jgi:hypothetical protein
LHRCKHCRLHWCPPSPISRETTRRPSAEGYA